MLGAFLRQYGVSLLTLLVLCCTACPCYIVLQLLLTKSADSLRSELLVGFDPVSTFLGLCCERYGHLATFCADPSGGFAAIGIKWRPEAFIPAPLRPNHAHGMMAIGATAIGTAAAAGGKESKAAAGGKAGVVKRGQHVGLVVPNVGQVLSEVAEMGLGLVQQVVLLQ
jgi:U3 small nucleolar RNA-associated protein 22